MDSLNVSHNIPTGVDDMVQLSYTPARALFVFSVSSVCPQRAVLSAVICWLWSCFIPGKIHLETTEQQQVHVLPVQAEQCSDFAGLVI